jgi:MSHA type pilus biogenesis protein MshL
LKIESCCRFGKTSQAGFLLFLIVFLLAGCAVQPKKPPELLAQNVELSPKELMKKYTQKGVIKKPSSSLAELAPLAPLEPKLAVDSAFPFEKKLFSMEVIDEPLGNVLLGLAVAADLNLILGQDVSRLETVSVKIKNLPLKDALDSIISVHNYYYAIEKNILRVEGLQTKFFTVDYPLVFGTPESETGGDVLGGGGGGGGESSAAISGSGLKGEFTIEVEVEDEEDLDIWKKIEESLGPSMQQGNSLLSEQGRADINRLAGTIVVTDRPKQLQMIEQYLDRVNDALHRQVVIEAKIVEVSLNKGHSYGIDWDLLKTDTDGNWRFNQTLSDGVGGAFTVGFADTIGPITGKGVLDVLATQGDVNVLSSPRLNVINNQSALISVGRVIPYLDLAITTTEEEVGDEAVLRASSEPVIARTLEGVTLGITPQISADGVTTLHIVPIITEQSGTRVLSVQGENFEVPVFSVRESDTMVKVADRQTIVIGGLIQEKTDDSVKKIPILGDIPLLKTLFSQQSRETSKTELVILLTTTVVK